jgi:hypothetical protein
MDEPKLKSYWKRRWHHFALIAFMILPLIYNGHVEMGILFAIFLLYLVSEEERGIKKLYYEYRGAYIRFEEGKKIIEKKFNNLQNSTLKRAVMEAILDPLISNKYTDLTVKLRKVYDAYDSDLLDIIHSVQHDIINNINDKDNSILPPDLSTPQERAYAVKELNIIKEYCSNKTMLNSEYFFIKTRLIIQRLTYILDYDFTKDGYDKIYKKINNQLHLLHFDMLPLYEVISILDDLKNEIINLLENDVMDTKIYR